MSFRTLYALGLSLAFFTAPSHAQEAEAPAEGDKAEEAKKTADEEEEEETDAAPSASGSAGLKASTDSGAQVSTGTSAAAPEVAEVTSGESNVPQRPPVYGKRSDWFIEPYGYARMDAIGDSTQSFEDGIQPNLIARAGTYRGDHQRITFTARDSRFGIYIAAPELHGVKTHAQLELDFFGLAPTDARRHDVAVFGPLRLRHAFFKMETSVIDVVAGQTFSVFGWNGSYYPASAAFLGVPGQLYHRDPQVRLEKTIDAGSVEIVAAAAAVRPGQRDSGVPDVQGGLKIAFNGWTGASMQGFGRPSVAPLSIGVSGMYRWFEVPAFRPEPASEALTTTGYGIAAQALIPVIPASTIEDRGNALTLTGEFSTGTGIADMYTGMDGGSRFPLLPNPNMAQPALIYQANVDPGLVTIDRNWDVAPINWRAFVAGLQYYLPIGGGRVWLAGIYSRIWSDNIKELTPAPSWGGVFTKMEYIDGTLGVDITPALVFGLSFQTVKQTFGDVSAPTPIYGTIANFMGPLGIPTVEGTGGVQASARNNRGQLTMAFFF